MRKFEENQVLRHIALGWILMAALIILVIIGIIQPLIFIFTSVETDLPLTDFIITLSTSLIAIILISFLFFTMQLKIRIDDKGIFIEYPPFLKQKAFLWEDIQQAYVKRYHPIKDYGGWGYRGFGKKKAYNLSGRWGIQLMTKNGKQILIGTQQPEKVRQVLQHYGFGNIPK